MASFADSLKNFRLDKLRFKSKDAIGVDLGSTAVKIVQLKGTPGRWKLHRCAHLPLPNASPEVPAAERRTQAVNLLKDFLSKQKGAVSKNAVFSVAGNSVIVRFVKFPKMSRDDLSKMILIEAEPYIPFSIPEVNLDFHILGDVVEEGQKKNGNHFGGREKRNHQLPLGHHSTRRVFTHVDRRGRFRLGKRVRVQRRPQREGNRPHRSRGGVCHLHGHH
jgi:hypothetical protein